ncbi:M20 family metallo-hydrolase [Solibacillus sp. FSL W7-1472]|uniref:M20 family metallo-hydrolase n=1 Tax=Solibacillus sp. FSL W7-1472 TaxID=2921707 RepID=UPI0030DB1AE4
MEINKKRLENMFEVVSEFGKIGETGLCRATLSPEEKQTFETVTDWLEKAGISVHVDNFGNLIGRLEGKNPHAPALVMGSHLDSQPYGGRFDGTSGVLAGVEVLLTMVDKGIQPEVPIEVISFADEESWRFKKGLFGSRGIAGLFEEGELERTDKQGITRRQALIDFGCDPDKLEASVYPKGAVGAFLELHIEQGPYLDVNNKPIGIVKGIAGPLWLTVEVEGFAGHAGSVPMNMRQDALLAASKMVTEINRIVRAQEDVPTVATVGSIRVFPDSPNIIPEKVEFTIDLRDIDLERRNAYEEQIRMMINEVAVEYNVSFSIVEDTNQSPVTIADWIQAAIKEESEQLGLDCPIMMSGPFHDATVMASICDVGMIFVSCKDGISHNPAEYASYEDLALGTELLYQSALNISSKIAELVPQ